MLSLNKPFVGVLSTLIALSAIGANAQTTRSHYPVPRTVAGALTTVTLPGSYFHVSAGSTHSVVLAQPTYIKNITVQAEANRDTTLEVVANGVTKGTIYVPAKDPSYIVTIEEFVQSLEFRSINGGTATVHSVVATTYGSFQTGGHFRAPVYSGIINRNQQLFDEPMLRDIQGMMTHLRDIIPIDQWIQFCQPLRWAASQAQISISVYGPFSSAARTSLLNLLAAIDRAQPVMDQMMMIEAYYDLAVKLQIVTETLRRDTR